jgi:hypothetical protein
MAPERSLRPNAEAAKTAAVVVVDKADVVRVDTEPASKECARRIDDLAMSQKLSLSPSQAATPLNGCMKQLKRSNTFK